MRGVLLQVYGTWRQLYPSHWNQETGGNPAKLPETKCFCNPQRIVRANSARPHCALHYLQTDLFDRRQFQGNTGIDLLLRLAVYYICIQLWWRKS